MSTSHRRSRSNSDEDLPPASRPRRGNQILSEVPLHISLPISNAEANYVCVIIPKESLDDLKDLLSKSLDKSKKGHSIITADPAQPSAEEPQTEEIRHLSRKFLSEFEVVNQAAMEHNMTFPDSSLKKDLPTEDFQQYRHFRKELTTWFTTCQHLENKLRSPTSDSNKYLKINFNFSPAVKNDDFKQKMTDTIIKTAENIEKKCTVDILNKAIALNATVESFFENENISKKLFFAKAIRTVYKSNRHLFHNRPRIVSYKRQPKQYQQTHRQYHRQPANPTEEHTKFTERRRQRQTRFSYSDRHRPSHRSYRDDEEYPEIQNVDHDYRRYKRDRKDPQYWHSRREYHMDLESDDDVFSDNNFRSDFRTYRNNRY